MTSRRQLKRITEDIVRLDEQGYAVNEIARIVRRSPNIVYLRLREQGRSRFVADVCRKRKARQERLKKVYDMHSNFYSLHEIAKALRVPLNTIRRDLYDLRVQQRKREAALL